MATENQLLDDDGSIFATEDGLFLSFLSLNPNPHFLEKEIHRTFNWDTDTANSFKDQIVSLLDDYPISKSQNFHMLVHVVQEFNKKAYKFGLISSIIGPTDAGFRPLNLDDLLNDFLLLENSFFMLQEDGNKLIPDS